MNGLRFGGWARALDDGRVECELCPRRCRLRDGQRGFCFVRQRVGSGVALTAYGKSTGFFADPIEKKPLFHFLPGTLSLSFGAAGCNLRCRFCENWALSRTTTSSRLSHEAAPEKIAQRAAELRLSSVAFTYNEPLISAEMVLDVAAACRERGIAAVAVSSGYATKEAARAFYGQMDAVTVGLKGFTDDGYRTGAAAHIEPVLETMRIIKRETRAWLELSAVLLPGACGSKDVAARCEWILKELGPEVPVHLLPFRPSFEMSSLPATSPSEAWRVRQVALGAGLRHVYVEGDQNTSDTRCGHCSEILVSRDAGAPVRVNLRGDKCPRCASVLAGRFGSGAPGCASDQWEPARWCG